MSTSVDTRLAEVYSSNSAGALSETYDNWAASYDADMLSTGYAHPAVICGLVSRFIPDVKASILDAGVGTGNVGTLLGILGYTGLHGIDMSRGMLDRARQRGVYAGLHQGVLGQQLNFHDGQFDAVISTGTFTTGHAPASAFDELMRVVKKGGYIIFTMGTVVWTQNGFADKLGSLAKAGLLKPVWTSDIYHPMPHSKTEAHFTTRAHVYQRA